MRAARVHHFGSPEVIVIDDVPRPKPSAGEMLVRVVAAGVGPWDALFRAGKANANPPLPFTLGSDLSGMVEAVGPDVSGIHIGDEVYGLTNPQFVGAQAEYAVASAGTMASKPRHVSHVEAASVPVVGVTAWQMLFEYARAAAGQSVLILGAAGNVGAYAVQLAVSAGLHVSAIAGSRDGEYVRSLGARTVVDHRAPNFERAIPPADVVLDLVGGETLERSLGALKSGGILVSVVSTQPVPQRPEFRSVFFYADVSTQRLNIISQLLDGGKLVPRVGTVLKLEEIRTAHEMLAGKPHAPGKIVLTVAE